MKYPKIPVMAATVRTGGAVVDELLAKGVPVWAVVHSKHAGSGTLERKGVETGARMTTPLFAFRKEFTARKKEIYFHAE
jgi:uncharacterized protein YbjT (DUF2867 family)